LSSCAHSIISTATWLFLVFAFEDKRMVNELMTGADCTVPYKDIQTVIDISFFLNMDLAEIMTTYFLSLMDPSHKLAPINLSDQMKACYIQ
jgi:hypothetical protein